MTPSTLREFRRQCAIAAFSAMAGDDHGAAVALREAALCLSARSSELDEGGVLAALVERRALLDRCAATGGGWTAGELAMVLQCGEPEAAAIIASGWPTTTRRTA